MVAELADRCPAHALGCSAWKEVFQSTDSGWPEKRVVKAAVAVLRKIVAVTAADWRTADVAGYHLPAAAAVAAD